MPSIVSCPLLRIDDMLKKEKTVSVRALTVKLLSVGFRRNRGQVAEVVVFTAVRDGFEVFRISTVGDANTGDLTLLYHVYCLLFFYNGIVRKLIAGNPAAFFYKADNPLCVGICLGNLIQRLLYKFLSVHIHLSFDTSLCR